MAATTINSLEQRRANAAYKFAQEGKTKEYKSLVKKTPVLIKNNGLGSTYAYLFAKSQKDHLSKLLCDQTLAWLKQDPKRLIEDSLKDTDGKDRPLVEILISLDSATYRAVTNEVLALFNWLRKFAEGMIQGEAD